MLARGCFFLIFQQANAIQGAVFRAQGSAKILLSHYINKLFRTFRSAHRPETAPYATSHYYNMIIHTYHPPVKKILFK